MGSDHSIPPLRDLPPDRLRARHQHLLAEITRAPERRFSRPIARPRLGLAALAAAGACVIIGGVVLVDGPSGEPEGSAGSSLPYLMQAIQPAWAHSYTHTGADGGLECAGPVQPPLLRCGDLFTVPRPQEAASSAPGAGVASGTEIIGGTDAERTLLRLIVNSTRPTAITQIDLISSKNALTLRMHALDGSTRTRWQEWLVAGAFRDRAEAAGYEVVVTLKHDRSGGVLPPGSRPTPPPANARAVETARRTFEDAAAKIDVDLDELTVFKPEGVAVAAAVTASDPAEFLSRRMSVFLAELGDLWQDYDGVYIRLTDDSGAIVWELAAAARTSTGLVRSRQDIAACSPIVDWGSIPPPCPAT